MLDQIKNTKSLDALKSLYDSVFGKNGSMTIKLKSMKDADMKTRAAVNAENTALRAAFKSRQEELELDLINAGLSENKVDITLDVFEPRPGKLHPLTACLSEISEIFREMGYGLRVGPEIEDDWHNFTALNTPPHHPARDMQDTFWLESGDVLRTQTSAIQVRSMETEGLPIKIIGVGATYRNDMDATHSPMFHQVEGLVINRDITLEDLLADIREFLSRFFGISDFKLRVRPSYFPFTEPSIEVDIQWDKNTGKMGTGNDWLEMGGAGMVHPSVIENSLIEYNKNHKAKLKSADFQGFAFGFGIDRLAMLKHGLRDLRKFFDGDLRWLTANGFEHWEV